MLLLLLMSTFAYKNIPTLHKKDLYQAKDDEILRIRSKYGKKISKHIYKDIIDSAKKGGTEYLLEFSGCENIDIRIDHTTCHHILEDVFTFISAKFPDVNTKYDTDNRIYHISWA